MGTTADLSMLSGKRFPILLGDQRSIWPGLPDSIPWEAIAPHERQAKITPRAAARNASQTGTTYAQASDTFPVVFERRAAH